MCQNNFIKYDLIRVFRAVLDNLSQTNINLHLNEVRMEGKYDYTISQTELSAGFSWTGY